MTVMLVTSWINLQRASAFTLSTNDARATARDAMSRISSELRAAQPTTLPSPSVTSTPTLEPPLTSAAPSEVHLHSAYNASGANADGSGTGALRATRIWLDPATQPEPWNQQARTLFLQRDMNDNGSFTDPGDTSMILARNVANDNVADALNGTAYTPVFRYAFRDTDGAIHWTDNADSSLDPSAIVAISVRLVIDRKMGGDPGYIDLTTTIRLRNASSN
jgi:hypothetical protein